MEIHSRKLSLATVAICFAAGLAAMAFTGQFSNHELSLDKLAQLCSTPNADAKTWLAYGQALLKPPEPDFPKAAQAFTRALEKDPRLQDALYYQAFAFGRANKNNEFFEAIKKLIIKDPKLAKEILERSELASMQNDPRYQPTLKNARSQAAD